MRAISRWFAPVLLASITSCQGCDDPQGIPDAGGSPDAVAPADAAPPDAALPPVLSTSVLDCGVAGTIGGLGDAISAQPLIRHDLDLSVFPEALCNDGTGAILYVRRAATVAAENDWVIQLQGGGLCGTAQECANRWCMVDTLFSMSGMSATPAPALGIDGRGITSRLGGNPLADANQVLVKYCSSDLWVGTQRDVPIAALHPVSGDPVAFRMHFLGARILDAAIATLRQDGVAAIDYQGTPMPDLDQATYVLVAGGSAGGAGVAHHVDALTTTLRATNAEVTVNGLADSILAPSLDLVDPSSSTLCATQPTACTADGLRQLQHEATNALWASQLESSCVAMHPTEPWRCFEVNHLLHHHVTSPLFVRMGLTDSLISDPFVTGGYQTLGGDPFNILRFAVALSADLGEFANLMANSEEGPATLTAPGVYGPTCSKHETLGANDAIYSTFIDDGGTPTDMFTVFENWRAMTGTTQLVSAAGASTCP
ncbi:MAG: hypothetical protein KA297_07395 [Kofleriaceae bacterium]|jgi:hypothetical protein|nr:hypothetical protein [Kofleriaceae bacterium]